MEVLSGVLAAVPLWLLWPIIVGIALYWYSTRNHNYWKSVGVPYVEAVPFLGSVGKSGSNLLHDIEIERLKTNGRIYGTYEGNRPILTVGDPEVLKDILVKDFSFFTNHREFLFDYSVSTKMLFNLNGEDWKRVRAIMTPSFSTGKIKKMTSITIDSAQTLIENFRKAAAEGKPLNVKRFLAAFTMDAIARSAFATKIDSHNDPDNSFVTIAKSVFGRNVPWWFLMQILFPRLMKLFGMSAFSPGPVQFFSDVTLKIVQERKRSGKKSNDFLQLMIDAIEEVEKGGLSMENDAASEIGHEENNEQILKLIRGSKSLSTDELVAQCVALFIGGYDNTSTILAFACYELALNPDIQEQLIAEIDESVREKGEFRYETIFEMKYLDCVVSETLRKYPVVIRTERIANEDYKIKNYDITIPKGMLVGTPIYAVHHDPENYPNPEKFDPERFLPEVKSTRHPYAYLPFSAGPRNCIAMRFALMQVKICLAYIFSQFRLHTCPETSVPLKFYYGAGLLNPIEVMLRVEERNDSPMK